MLPLKRKNPRYEMDMTEGPLLPQILSFSGPLILTMPMAALPGAVVMALIVSSLIILFTL